MPILQFACKADHLTIRVDGGKKLIKVYNKKELAQAFHDNNWTEENTIIQCLSSMDWPEDVTSSREIIEMTNIITGNNL